MKNPQNLNKVQTVELNIFKEFKRICDNRNIRYFAIAGTAIGAVRHSGFIPWDDDIDVAMPNSDIDKFLRACKTDLPPYLELDDRRFCKYGIKCIHLVDTRTTQLEEVYRNDTELLTGIHLDIMPLNGVPKNKFAYMIHMKILRALFSMANTRAGYGVSRYSHGAKLLAKRLLFPIVCLRSSNYYNKLLNRYSTRYNFDDKDVTYLARTWAFKTHDGMKNLARYHKSDFASYIEMPFEDTTIRLPKGYDRYLTSLYPGYMTPPPKEKQIPHHCDGILDLDHSYKYHIAKKHGKVIGYTAGCYDMFHIGHLNILQNAKKHCDYLIVGVNSDEAMYSYKQKYPIISTEERMKIIAATRYADEVVEVTSPDKMIAYGLHKYDVIFVGDDHKGEQKWNDLEKELAKVGSKVHYLPHTDGTSSTVLRIALNEAVRDKERIGSPAHKIRKLPS